MFFLIFFTLGVSLEVEAQSRPRSSRRGPVTPVGVFVRKGIYLDTAYFFGSNDVASSPSTNSSLNQTSFLDIKLGYINTAAFYYGGQYTLRNDATRTTKVNGQGTGFGIGYFWYLGFDVRGYYRFNESFGDYSKGSGYQVNVGYSTRVVSNLYLGILLDFREIKYQTYSLDPTIRSTSIRTIQPSATLGYLF